MLDIGGSLTAARQAQGLRLSDVEAITSIRAAQLTALEEERFGEFPGHAYARAFLRTYARALGLDADRLVDEFESRYEARSEPPPPPATVYRRRLAFPGRTAAAASVLLLATIGLIGALGAFSPQTTRPPRHAPTVARSIGSVLFDRRPMPPAAAFESTPVRRSSGGLEIQAVRGPCWIEVRRGGAGGSLIYEGTIEQGSEMRFPSPVWLRLGAPGNVVATRGGQTVAGVTSGPAIDLTA